MRNDVLQNYLDQFRKCLTDNFDNLKFQDVNVNVNPNLMLMLIQIYIAH